MRLDIERQNKLEPKRLSSTAKKIKELGFEVEEISSNRIDIILKNKSKIIFFPYSGWASGKAIKDCRGFNSLYQQLRNLKND